MNHLVVPIGTSHISSWHKKHNQGSGRKEHRTNEQYAWINSSARRLSCDTLHFLCICRLSLTCSFCEISTIYEECWLILTGLPSLLLDPISCRLVSSLSSVDCQLPLSIARRELLLWVPSSKCWLAFPYPLPVTSKIAGSGLCFVSRQNRQRDRLLSGPPTS